MLANTQYSYLDKLLLSGVIDYLIMLVLIFVSLLGVVNIIGYQSLMQTGWTMPIYWLAQPSMFLGSALTIAHQNILMAILVVVVPFAIEAAYYCVSVLSLGASLGQRVVGCRAVNQNLQPLSIQKHFGLACCKVISHWMFFLPALGSVVFSNKQTLYDKLLKVVVVEDTANNTPSNQPNHQS